MSNTKLNCCKCGKEFGFTERIYTCGDLWQCEDCAIKNMQENDNKDKTIADLEAKLAEKDIELELARNTSINTNKMDIIHLQVEILELKQQLATQENTITNLIEDNRASQKWYKKQLEEKEKEIENLNNRILISQLQAPKEQILNILGSQCIQYNPDQDKISFAVEQLTEIREYVKNCWSLDETEGKVRLDIAKKIRLKIEKLKEMK